MKTFTIHVLALFLLLSACQKDPISTEADDYFHVKTADAYLPVWVRGNTASQTILLFVNGGPGLTTLDAAQLDLLNWEQSLEKDYGIAYFDARGTGNAQGNFGKESITIAQNLLDIQAILKVIRQRYGDVTVFLIGHSYGGYLTARYLLNPSLDQDIAGWINVDGSLVFELEKQWAFRHMYLVNVAQEKIVADEEVAKWQAALDWAMANPAISTDEQKDMWRELVAEAFTLTEQEISFGAAMGILFASPYNAFPAYFSDNWITVLRQLFEESENDDLLPEMAQINLPSLFVYGRYDDIVPPEIGDSAFTLLGTSVANKEFHIVQDASHEPFADQPAAFAGIVTAFVEAHR